VVVGELEKRGVDLHLARQHRAQPRVHLVPRRDVVGPLRQFAVRRHDAELLLAGESFFAQLVPALVELALVLGDPVFRHVMRRVRGAGREIDEKRFVGRDRLLLADVADCLVGEIRHQVVALLGRALRFDRRGAVVELRVVLVVLPADESVEVLEAGAGGPMVERADRRRFEDRHFMALAKLRSRVAVELQDLGQRRAGVRPQ
jgi:hypothetical protein